MQYNVSYREKDGSWQYIISYKLNGKWKQKSKQGFPLNRKGKQAAKDSALKVLDKLKEDISLKARTDFEDITFGQFGREYLEHSKLYRSFETVTSTNTVLKNFSDLDSLKVSKITNMDIQKIVDQFTRSNSLNPNTIIYYLKKLRIIFNSAKNQYHIISQNPVKYIKVPKQKEITKKALTDKETADLLSSFKNTRYYLFLYIAVNTGMRAGEILGLTWNDIDIKKRIIHVNKQWKRGPQGTYGFGPLKSKNSKRSIPISKNTLEEILNHKNVIGMDNRVINFKATPLPCLNLLFKKRGFNISMHELRHTYATKLIANGIDFKTAANILGHNVRETLKRYSHVNQDMLNHAHDLIEDIF